MPSSSASYEHSYRSRPRNIGTLIHIGGDWRKHEIHSNMPTQTASRNMDSSHSSGWDNYPPQTSSRPTSRADSNATNISLKDTIDVFVEDKFFKSYNLNYEPVRIRIGDDSGQIGSVYSSRPVYGNQDSGSLSYNKAPEASYQMPVTYDRAYDRPASVRSSYHENTRETKTSSTGGAQQSSMITLGKTKQPFNPEGPSSQSNLYSRDLPSREYSVPIQRNDSYTAHLSRGKQTTFPNSVDSRNEYSVPITMPEHSYEQTTKRGSISIPINGEYTALSGRQTSVFSPDSGRDSIDLPMSRAGYVQTPLPATPLGRASNIMHSPEPYGNTNVSYARSYLDESEQREKSAPAANQSTYGASSSSQKRHKNVEFSQPETTGSLRHRSGSPVTNARQNGKAVPISANVSLESGVANSDTGTKYPHSQMRTSSSPPISRSAVGATTPSHFPYQSDFDSLQHPIGVAKQFSINKADLPERQTERATLANTGEVTRNPRSLNTTSERPRSRLEQQSYGKNDDLSAYPIGATRDLSINKGDLPDYQQDLSAIVNSPSLTYAVDDHSVPGSSSENIRSASRNRSRSRSRGDSNGRAASRVGLPTYERDYVDRSGDDSDLDNLSDEGRNQRLRQKKLIHPHSRNAALVAELKETTNNISASRRSRKEQEFTSRLEKKNYSEILDRFTAEQFVPQVPYYDEEGFAIAEYKRNFLAKQAANQARREFQARIDNGEAIEEVTQSPEWKRLFIDVAKEEYDGTPFKMGINKDALHINVNKHHTNKLQPWQLELKRLDRFND